AARDLRRGVSASARAARRRPRRGGTAHGRLGPPRRPGRPWGIFGMTSLTGERVEVPADPTAFYELSLAEQWGDGAPLLPPTDEAIEMLLACTPDPRDQVVGVLPPRAGVATVELVAANAAMAGVQPEAFPLVLAA